MLSVALSMSACPSTSPPPLANLNACYARRGSEAVDSLFRSQPVARSAREDAVEVEIAKVKAELELVMRKPSAPLDTSFFCERPVIKGKSRVVDAFKPKSRFPEPRNTGAFPVIRMHLSAISNFLSFSSRSEVDL
jgi:hypothetical protein